VAQDTERSGSVTLNVNFYTNGYFTVMKN